MLARRYLKVGVLMRITITFDDELVRIAQELTGITGKGALIREALKALIQRESARRLAALGGIMPRLKNIENQRLALRRRSNSELRISRRRPASS